MLKLIPEWRQAPRMWSVRIAAAFAAWAAMPADTQAAVLHLVGLPAERVPAVMALLVIVARVVEQPRLRAQQQATAALSDTRGGV